MTMNINMAKSFRLDKTARNLQIAAMVAMLGMIALLLSPLILFGWALGDHTYQIDESRARSNVAYILMRTAMRGPLPDVSPSYENLETQFAKTILHIRGFGCADGFHGDGSDWYEVHFTPELLAELRAFVASPKYGKVKLVQWPYPRDTHQPDWWPVNFSNYKLYHCHDWQIAISSDSEIVWIQNWRS